MTIENEQITPADAANKAVDWTISQLAKQITMSAETRKAYKRAFMMSLRDNGKAQGKK